MKLNSIIKFINDSWSEALGAPRFAGSGFYGLSSQVPKPQSEGADLFQITAFDEKGQVLADNLIYQEKFPVLIYHRLSNTNITSDDRDSFGNDLGQKRTFYCSAFVYVNKSKVQMEAADMELILTSAIPQQIPSASLINQFAGVKSCNITPTGSDFNQVNLFGRELNMKSYTMEPRIVLFELKYLIECTYSRDCINVLCCP